MTEPIPLPHLNFFVLCEDVRQESEGVLAFVDVLRHIIYTGESEEPPLYTFDPVLAVGIYDDNESTAYRLEVSVGTPDGGETPLGEIPIGFYDGSYKPTQFGRVACAVTPGVYWFRIRLGRRILGQHALRVSYQQEIAQ